MQACGHPVAASLDARPFCRQHFIVACYEKLDLCIRWLEDEHFQETNADLARHFLAECTRHATELAQNVAGLQNLERARLLDIVLRASEVCRHLRRTPRKVASIPVRLQSQKTGSPWEEETQTRVLSRHGALLECQHPVETDEILIVVRMDTGQKAQARVAWQRCTGSRRFAIGIEFLGEEKLWNIDWDEL